ncbi:reverse transcriptase domain-containing protein, partial [Tanacetum coccineum]
MAPERRPTVNRNPPVNRLTNRNNVDINSGIDTQMLNQLIATRVAEALAAAASCMKTSVKVTESTWWNVYVRSVTLDTAHATPWSDFKAMFIRKYCPRNEVKQMENELWNLKVKGTNLTAYNQHFQELILLCTQRRPVVGTLHRSVDDTTLTHALLLVTTVERKDIRPKTAELHLVSQTKEDQEAKEDREVMSLVSEVAKKDITRTSVRTIEVKAVETKFEATNKILRTIKGKIKETLKE